MVFAQSIPTGSVLVPQIIVLPQMMVLLQMMVFPQMMVLLQMIVLPQMMVLPQIIVLLQMMVLPQMMVEGAVPPWVAKPASDNFQLLSGESQTVVAPKTDV